MLASEGVYLLPIDSQVTEDVEGVEDGDVEDFDRSGLCGKRTDVEAQSVERLDKGVGCGETVGECLRVIGKGAT